jgi:hypothetical protein
MPASGSRLDRFPIPPTSGFDVHDSPRSPTCIAAEVLAGGVGSNGEVLEATGRGWLLR